MAFFILPYLPWLMFLSICGVDPTKTELDQSEKSEPSVIYCINPIEV